MSIVYSVSGITGILSGIIRNTPTLQEVGVQGIISPAKGGSGYLLGDGKNQIRCFIAPPIPPKFKVFLKSKTLVVVYGKIRLFSQVNQYEILVQDIQPIKKNIDIGDQSLSVSEITKELSNLVENQNELQDIRIQGEIVQGPPGLSDFILTLSDRNPDDIAPVPEIQCILPKIIPQKKVGNEIHVRGKIKNFGSAGIRYQIDISDMELISFDDDAAKCECSGCDQCLPVLGSGLQCNRPGSPVLCPKCYEIGPNPEDKVVEHVESYFSQKFQGFSTAKECEIQMGVDQRRADLVLIDRKGIFAAIAECKGNNIVGYGPNQLKSYLCATDTRFGVFANSTDPDSWSFFENLGGNQCPEIDRSEFEEAVVKGITLRKQLKDEIKSLESNRNQLRAEIGELETEKAEAARQVREESEKLDAVKQAIESDRAHNQDLKSIQKHLSDAIEQLRIDRTKLETEVAELERKERELHAFREQRKEKLQRFETIFNDLKSDLLDLGSPPPPGDNTGPQKPRENKKQGIKNWFKNRFSKENK